MKMDLELDCKSVSASNEYRETGVRVSIEKVDQGDVLDHFSIKEIMDYFGEDKFLDEIGEDEVIRYFGIEVKENEDE